MGNIFDTLPGLETPVAAISRGLADLWLMAEADGKAAPAADDAKATQVNLVLHLGFGTTAEDAAAQFQTVERFAQRYPSRIVVLCPLKDDAGVTEIRAKIYGQCYLGKSQADKRCVEFVMLSYPRSARNYLEDQVSICLSTDLPLYYWAHRFTKNTKLADYRFLLSRAKRVLIDSAIAPVDAFSFPWPNPSALRDLAYCRLLPVRQTIGQFLAGYTPLAIIDCLRGVKVSHATALVAEGRVISAWLRRRLAACGAKVDELAISCEAMPSGSFSVSFDYAKTEKFFRWTGDIATQHALFEANFGNGPVTLFAPMSVLEPGLTLSEAMFC